MKGKANWSRPLNIETRKGVKLAKLSDLRAYLLTLDERRQHDRHWQHAAKLALEAAEGGDMEALRKQLMLAFLLSGDLVGD